MVDSGMWDGGWLEGVTWVVGRWMVDSGWRIMGWWMVDCENLDIRW